MLSLLASVDGTLKTFFNQLTESLGFGGYLGLVLGVELLFILLFVIKSIFSYEARLKRSLDNANKWLFKFKKIDINNIKAFNSIIKKGPKRLMYFWQQFILYRDGGPNNYLTEENLIDKPLKTSDWATNIRNLGILTVVWSLVSLIFGLASQVTQTFGFQSIVVALILPALVAILGVIAIIILKARRVANLDDIYHIYHIFIRFLTNASVDLTPYLDFNLLFTDKELENGSPELREYYETRARKIKEEFENAKKNDIPFQNYKFEEVGVDGRLLLNRAMKESEKYINKKNATLSQIAQIEAQKDALRRNYENVQMDLQRKIQVSKENIQKLIEQQAATTSRIEVGLLRQQQEKEVNKKASLQQDYDKEEQRYLSSKEELEKEIQDLNKIIDESVDEAEKGMTAEYQTFFEKVMKSAYQVAENKVKEEKKSLENEKDKNEQELISVQTQIKRLKDENDTLRERLSQFDANYMNNDNNQEEQGYYDENGNYIYSDGSYHDVNGLFHDVDGKVYNMNGELVSQDISPEEQEELDKEAVKNEQINSFGAYVDDNSEVQPSINNEEQKHEDSQISQQKDTLNDASGDLDYSQPTFSTGENEDENNASNNEIIQDNRNKINLSNALISNDNTTDEITEDEEMGEKENEIQRSEEIEPKKKRGRPRKIVSEEEVENKEPKKRGRPRKNVEEVNEADEKPAQKKRGRPRKNESDTLKENATSSKINTKQSPKSKTSSKTKDANNNKSKQQSNDKPKNQVKKRGRPRKTESNENAETSSAPKKRGRPRKQSELSGSFLDKINELISQEENKLKNMKAFLNSEIDQALEPEDKNNISQEKDDIMTAVEALKEQANKAKSSGQSEELSKVNKRIEDLIKELSNINSDETNDTGTNTAQ